MSASVPAGPVRGGLSCAVIPDGTPKDPLIGVLSVGGARTVKLALRLVGHRNATYNYEHHNACQCEVLSEYLQVTGTDVVVRMGDWGEVGIIADFLGSFRGRSPTFSAGPLKAGPYENPHVLVHAQTKPSPAEAPLNTPDGTEYAVDKNGHFPPPPARTLVQPRSPSSANKRFSATTEIVEENDPTGAFDYGYLVLEDKRPATGRPFQAFFL